MRYSFQSVLEDVPVLDLSMIYLLSYVVLKIQLHGNYLWTEIHAPEIMDLTIVREKSEIVRERSEAMKDKRAVLL